MALPDLTGQNIQDTYKRVLQTDHTGQIYDGTGSLAPILQVTASYATSASYAISASHEITYELSASHSETSDLATSATSASYALSSSLADEANVASGLQNSPNIVVSSIISTGVISASQQIRGTSLSSKTGYIFGDASLPTQLVVDGFLKVAQHITASGNISSSGAVIGTNFLADTSLQVANKRIDYDNTNLRVRDTGLTVDGHITASGNISSSGAIRGGSYFSDSSYAIGTIEVLKYESGRILLPDNLTIEGSIQADQHITASGNISASGIITGEGLVISDDASVADDLNIGGNITAVTDIHLGNDIKMANNAALISQNSSTTFIGLHNDDYWKINANGIAVARFTSAGLTINEDSAASCDFRVESDADQHQIFSDAGTNKVGIGTATPPEKLTVEGNISASGNILGDQYKTQGQTLGLYHEASSTIRLADSSEKTRIYGTNIKLDAPVTASGNISASGDMIAKTYDAKTSGTGYKLSGAKVVYTHDNATILGGSTTTAITGSSIILGRTAVTHVTASGNISASGEIYSNNIEKAFYTFQLANTANADTWYGPNSQGPYYYYWNKSYASYPNTGLANHTSGYVLPCKAELISTRFVIHPTSTSPSCNASASVIVLSSDDFSYPLETSPNSDLRVFQPGTVSGIDTRYGHYEISNGEISGSYPAGTFIYPRIRLTEAGHSVRGYWELSYRKIK